MIDDVSGGWRGGLWWRDDGGLGGGRGVVEPRFPVHHCALQLAKLRAGFDPEVFL